MYILESNVFTDFNKSLNYLIENKDRLIILKYPYYNLDFLNNQVSITNLHCSLNLLRQIKYHEYNSLDNNFSFFQLEHLNSNLLNSDYEFRTIYQIVSSPLKYMGKFIKPVSSLKLFNGGIVTDDLLNMLSKKYGNTAHLCVISSPKNIINEYRIILKNREYCTGSLYREQGQISIANLDNTSEKNEIINYINSIKKLLPIYDCCLDIAKIDNNDKYKVIEINSISCGDWYDCDTSKILGKN